jgi:hypothetical protein
MSRINLSKKLRFEIFKRDVFTCQYCGAHPPAVILEVDHIVPVASDGGNDEDNLVTSCFDCNRGKAARPLDVAPMPLAEKAELVAESERQLKGYNDILTARRERLDADVWTVFESLNGAEKVPAEQYNSVLMFVKRLGLHEVLEAADIAASKQLRGSALFRYFCGVCWGKIKDAGL